MKNILSRWAQALAFLGGKKKVEKPDSMKAFFDTPSSSGLPKLPPNERILFGVTTEELKRAFQNIKPIFPEDRIETH